MGPQPSADELMERYGAQRCAGGLVGSTLRGAVAGEGGGEGGGPSKPMHSDCCAPPPVILLTPSRCRLATARA